MPVSTAPNEGDKATGLAIRPSHTKRLVMPAVRENSVDQAKPMMTSESDSTESRHTSQMVCTFRDCLRQQIGEREGDRHAHDRHRDRQHQREAEHLAKNSDRKRA